MSLYLNLGTTPENLRVKTTDGISQVSIGKIVLTMEDFCVGIQHVMEETKILPGDPRKIFLEKARAARIKNGWNTGYKRIVLGHTPTSAMANINSDMPHVPIWDYKISMEDLFIATAYVMENTDLCIGDPRIDFLGRLKRAQCFSAQDGLEKIRIPN